MGGVVLGSREALVTLEANAFVQPTQYFGAYVAVPILACMLLGVLLMVLCAVAVAVLRREPCTSTLPVYMLAFGVWGGLSIAAPWIGGIGRRFAEVGVAPSWVGWSVLTTLGGVLIIAGAAALHAVGASHEEHLERFLKRATPVNLGVALLLLWPIGRFLTTDWKWQSAAAGVRVAVGGDSPNVVLISVDTLRADHLGSYGSPHGLTPQLDRFATDGVLFENAITSSPWTLPAMASVLTGLSPSRHAAGAIANRRDPLGRAPLRAGSWTLTSALRERGYATQAIVTNPYLALHYGLGEGFQGYENITIESEIFLGARDTTAGRLVKWLWPEVAVGDRGATVSDRAIRWLEQFGRDRPFFLWVHYVDPHPPYSRAGVTHHKSFRGDSLLGAIRGDAVDLSLTSPDVARLRSGELRMSAAQKEAVRRLYQAEVASVDSAVGRVLEGLDRLGLGRRTIVVLVADHGEEFWEHGGVEHGHTVYDELIRIPLIMRWPGHLPAGRRVRSQVGIADVAPTVLAILGIPPPSNLNGWSLLPLIDGTSSESRIAVVENLLFAEERIGVRTLEHKYVRWENGKEEAYSLYDDPRELRDLGGVPTVIGPLRDLYTANVKPEEASGPIALPTADPATLKSLKALG